MADLITEKRLREVLHYDPLTGVFTAMTRGGSRWPAGRRAGYIRPDGYWMIEVDCVPYLGHRLAWLWVYGVMPKEIDHINRDRADNRLSNLRLATRSQNGGNGPRKKNNTSGFKGVTWNKKTSRWNAQIMINRRHIHLGSFDNPHSAHEAYMAAARRLYGEYARAE